MYLVRIWFIAAAACPVAASSVSHWNWASHISDGRLRVLDGLVEFKTAPDHHSQAERTADSPQATAQIPQPTDTARKTLHPTRASEWSMAPERGIVPRGNTNKKALLSLEY